MQLFIEQRLFQIELYLDFVARTESATDEAAKMAHRQKMVALKTAKEKVFPDEAGVIVMDIRRENQANLIATAMELLIMHNEIIKGLIENEQNFLDKVKNNAKAEKQHGNENKNNGKEDEEEKREGAEKGDEKGREKEDEIIGEEGETEKEDKKGREKVEQKGGSEEDEKGREEEDEKEGEQLEQKGGSEGDEKEKEDKKGGEGDEKGGCEEDEKEKGDKKGGEKEDENGIEKEDESIGEKGKKKNEDKKGREKVKQKGGSEEDEKEKEDKKRREKENEKGREQVEQKGGSGGEKKEKEDKKEKGGEEDAKGRDEMAKGDKKGRENGENGRDEKEKEHKKEKEKVEQKGGGDEKGGEGGGAEDKRCVDSYVQFEKDDEMGRLYLALFASAGSAKVFQAEINLGIKMLELQINKLEQLVRNSLNYTEIMMARAKLRATAAVQLNLRHDEKFRIICGQIAYVSYLSQKMEDPFTLWNSPTKCFSISREDTLSSLRTAHRECHWDFVMNRLADPEENSFLSTVRQKRGTLALLEKLIGGPLLNMLWKTNEAPANALLLDANMAVDYVSDRMRDIKSADLIVWMQWFQSAHNGQAGHSINREFIWLYARVFYDRYGNGFDKYFEAEFSRIEVLMEKITQMHTAAPAFALQKGICCKLPEKWRTIIKEGTINESILEVIESEEGKGRKTETNEFVQQLHFVVIRELCQNSDQTDEMVQRKIGNIIKMLKQSKDYRRNLKELLNKEQIREIFQLIVIPFDEKEFEGTDQQMAFLSVEKIDDQQKKKRRKNRRKKNGQKLGMNEENESEQTEEKTESKIEEKEKNKKERTEKEEEKEAKEEKMDEEEKEVSKKEKEMSQQLIRDEFDEQNSQKLEQFVAERAINGKTEGGMSQKKREKRIKAALKTIKGMAGKWSADQAKLFISGSFLLELNTIDSDLDLICVVPGKMIKNQHFLGEQNEICVEKKCENGKGAKGNLTTPKSFYCHLCENEKVNDLLKISHGQLMMLKFTFDGIDFDISFVAIPKLEALAQRITDGTLRNYYENFIAINCIGQDKITMQNFCQFVETRIRIQLAYDISQRGTTTNWHIYPALYQETCQITQKLEEIPYEIRSDYHHCKLWLIGTDHHLMDANEKRQINRQLLNFDWAIKRDFLKFNGKLSNKSGADDINGQFNEMRVNLKSVFARNMDIF
ncbi:hypothetical protein niasHS_015826 [Heterodera schachtii]|uniref:Polymerase nucleotidyl transferase domain-containing protein n=1 Tax=Heterodera schachtii TaxID=97005 RepID=A0ABD2HS80_HETSC